MLEVAQLVLCGNQPVERSKGFFKDRRGFMKVGNLVQCADHQSISAADDPCVRLCLRGDQLEQRRLARSVCSDETDFFGWINLEVDVPKDRLRPKRFGNAAELNKHDWECKGGQ